MPWEACLPGLALGLALACASGGCSSSDAPADPGPATDAGAETSLEEEDGAAPVNDGGPGKDAADARPDAPAPGTHYCTKLPTPPRFCDDFDDDGDLTDDWTQSAAPPGAVFELDTTSSSSAPASFHVVAKASAAVAANNVLLRSTMFGVVKHARLELDVFLPSVTFTQGAIAIAQFYVNLHDVFTLYLRGPDDAANIPMLESVVNGMLTRHMLTSLPTAGAWTHVLVDLDLAGGKASVSFGAQKALDSATIDVLTGTEATVRIGAIIDGPNDAFEARFDDVVIDY